MKSLLIVTCVAIVSISTSRGQLDGGSPGDLPPGINPPGESASGCCAGLPVATPMPEPPLPTCPGGVAPIFGPGGSGVVACLPTAENSCPPNSGCWYNGIDFYCCPMEGAPGYGHAPPRPITGYGGIGRPSRPSKPGKIKPPGSFPTGVNPPSDSGDTSAPGSLPKGVNPPADSAGSSNQISPPGSVPKGINPPASSEEDAYPSGKIVTGIRPPADRPGDFETVEGSTSPWKNKPRPSRLRPPPLSPGTFPNPFTCCGDGFHAPSHLPKNINAPSERAIGYIQFFSGSHAWPPKDTGKAKFGGPVKPDILWFPGHHPHFTNELGCCGEGANSAYGAPSPPTGYGRPETPVSPPAKQL